MMEKPKCFSRKCKHYSGVKWLDPKEEISEVHYCVAFPEGIPDEITYGSNKHLTPEPGDGGVVFEKEKK